MKCPYCTKILNSEEEKVGYCCDVKEIIRNIKGRCIICSSPISSELKDFITRGNWCVRCSGIAQKRTF